MIIGAYWKSTENICCPQDAPGRAQCTTSLSVIVRDIRAAHKSDNESAPPTTIAEELKQDLEDIANFKGSPLEKQAALYCKRLGINYNKLSDVEFRQLVHILEKSKYFKSYAGQRKKRK